MSRMKPMSSMRSASSRTTTLTRFKRRAFCSKRSLRRPGVPMITCGLRFNALICGRMFIPPRQRAEYMPSPLAKPRNSSSICTASSRVGAMTRAGPECLLTCIRWMIGSMKAAVLPVPVLARPTRSRPARTGFRASSCTGVGLTYPRSIRFCSNFGVNPKSANVWFGLNGSCSMTGTALFTNLAGSMYWPSRFGRCLPGPNFAFGNDRRPRRGDFNKFFRINTFRTNDSLLMNSEIIVRLLSSQSTRYSSTST